MIFWLGTHKPHWLERTAVPLFISRRRLIERKRPPVALGSWALDSGGFTELSRPPHHWTISEDDYVELVDRWRDEIPGLAWAAPMDWMCEPSIVAATGLDVAEHQRRTVANFVRLRARLGPTVIPVLQGWASDEYLRCADSYARAGVDLAAEPLVGLGSICRRGQDAAISTIVRSLDGLRLHGFGVRGTALAKLSDVLASADSLAWSARARRAPPLPGCSHARCTNCLTFALAWREQRLNSSTRQLRLEVSS